MNCLLRYLNKAKQVNSLITPAAIAIKDIEMPVMNNRFAIVTAASKNNSCLKQNN